MAELPLRSAVSSKRKPKRGPKGKTNEFYAKVPKDRVENLKYRQQILERAKTDREYREALWIACKRDLLFFCNVFGFLYEPRDARVLPFVTRPRQDVILQQFDQAIDEKRDCVVLKSRDEGCSWAVLYVYAWRFLFYRRQSFLCISRTEDEVDKTDDSDALFWKLDFIFEHLPTWMKPSYERQKLHFKNNDNGSLIDGRSTTGNSGRGGRRTSVFEDEKAAFSIDDGYRVDASMTSVTKTRIQVSTPQGDAGSFADAVKRCRAGQSDAIFIELAWWHNPAKNPGLYRSENGHLKIVDETYPFPANYPFILDGKIRSPWRDAEGRRYPHSKLEAQELDLDLLGSGFTLFAETVASHRHYERSPYIRGEIVLDEHELTMEFMPHPEGRLLLWLHLSVAGTPPADEQYSVGADIATGLGGVMSSRSALSGWNKATGEKVAQFATSEMEPYLFAKYGVALCRWLNNAFHIWEANGPGKNYGMNVWNAGYRHVYYRADDEKVRDKNKRSDKIGWWSSTETKKNLLMTYSQQLKTGELINRSKDGLDECLEYVMQPSGAIVHSKALAAFDPQSHGENHGDVVIADALGAKGISEIPRRRVAHVRKAPEGSLAWRREQRAEKVRREKAQRSY